MAVLRPRRLFRWTTIIPTGAAVVAVGLFSLCVFSTVGLLLVIVVSLFWFAVPVRWCFEMRELLTDRLGFVDEWLLVVVFGSVFV